MILVGNIYAGLGGGGSGINIYNSDGALTGNRTLTVGANSLEFVGDNGTNAVDFLMDNTPGGSFFGLQVSNSGGSHYAGVNLLFNNNADYNVGFVINNNGNASGFEIDGATGIGLVTDGISFTGLQGVTDFSAINRQANPNLLNYPQNSNVPFFLDQHDFTAQTISQTLVIYTVGTNDSILEIAWFLNVEIASGGSAQLQLAFTNTNGAGGTPQQFNLSTALLAAGNAIVSPVVIKAQRGTTVSIKVAVIGSITYGCGGVIKLIKQV
jgi:hypothetical protein